MVTDVNLIHSVHYTQCRKPWNCIGVGADGGRIPGGKPASAIDTLAGNFEHCMTLIGKWHKLRLDLEESLYALTQDESIFSGRGNYKEQSFYGHCAGEGGANYTKIHGARSTFQRINEMYSR